MNHKIFSSFTASLLIASLGVPPSSTATPLESNQVSDQSTESTSKSDSDAASTPASLPGDAATFDNQSAGVVKVGEQQAQTSTELIAKVHPHEISGREAATLYVRNLPILTFLGARKVPATEVKVGTQTDFSPQTAKAKTLTPADVITPSLASLLRSSQVLVESNSDELNLSTLDTPTAQRDPVWRATVIAAKLNQLHRDRVDADQITVSWDSPQKDGRDRFVIRTDKLAIAFIDSETLLPDTTRNLEKDALQATNRLRRVLGAAPLREVTGKPAARTNQDISFGPIRVRLTGFASWYGPGFHGNPSASGERFNQHAMTAAHRTLPFGTRVLVTNLDNGQSIVVRINDRGPFHGNRIIDLSTAAARIIGLMQSGVAPVRLEVMDSRSATAVSR